MRVIPDSRSRKREKKKSACKNNNKTNAAFIKGMFEVLRKKKTTFLYTYTQSVAGATLRTPSASRTY